MANLTYDEMKTGYLAEDMQRFHVYPEIWDRRASSIISGNTSSE